MFATKPFWDLGIAEHVPLLPYGYQTMGSIALIPPLWRHIMTPLLADWDARFANEAEQEIIRSRGWAIAPQLSKNHSVAE
jgi:alkane 1-monooxygenase